MEQTQLSPPSLATTILDVFSAPQELFNDYHKTATSHKLWLIPLIVNILFSIIVTFVMFSNDALRMQVLDVQRQAIEQQVQQQKITQEQADQFLDRMESANIGMYVGFASFGIIIGYSLFFFLGTLVLWLANKLLFHTSAGFVKHLEVYGISSWIGIVGSLIGLLLVLALGSIYAQPAASIIFYDSFDATQNFHRVLSAINFFSLWQTIVLGIALAKLSERPLFHGIALTTILWLLWIPVSIALNIGR